MTAFKELLIGGYVLRFWPSDNGWICGITESMMDALAQQTNPLQRTWEGLTADEMLECLKAVDAATAVNLLMSQYKMPPTFKVYAEAIEAKLREKNHG